MGPFDIGFGDFFAGLLVTLFVVAPFIVLVHELGHACVALRLASGPVVVHVGRPPIWLGVDCERLKIRWSAVPPRGVPFAGICVWRRGSVSNRAKFAVSIAGPLAELSLLPIFLLAATWTSGSAQWIPATFGWSALLIFVNCLFNADPRLEGKERANPGAIRRDGPKALAAYRAWRAE